MASTLVDLVKINIISLGDGPLTLGTAVDGYRGREALINGNTYSYSIRQGSRYEYGRGTYLATTGQLVRSPIRSSDGGPAIKLDSGAMIAFVPLAEDLDAVQLTADVQAAATSIVGDAAQVAADRAAVEAAAAAFPFNIGDIGGAALVGTPDGDVQAMLNQRIVSVATRTELAGLNPARHAAAYLIEDGREGMFKLFPGSPPVTDLWQGLYVVSDTASYYWARLWGRISAQPEWFGVVPNSYASAAGNDARMAACYASAPITQASGADYYFTDTVKANIENHGFRGTGKDYTGVNAAPTRFLVTNGTSDVMQQGADTYPGSINACPQGITVKDIFLGRTVAPVIASGCRGLVQQFALNAVAENVKTDSCMIGIEANGVIHTHQTNCVSVRANAGTGAGTDYFVGNYANGNSTIGAAGGNASLYIRDCSAECNYGPLQTATGSIGFKADQAFTDVWYWNPETVNFYDAQQVLGNDATGLVFSNTDLHINHPIHDQFKHAGLYVTDVAASGSVEIETPYYGPSSSARASYWVNSSEGAVASRGGQFVMGAAPNCQPILLDASRSCDVLDYPVILEAGATYPLVSANDVNDARIEVFAKNANTTSDTIIQLSGTCVNIQAAPKSSGKNSAYQYGVKVVGTGVTRSTINVSGLNSANFPAANRKLNWNTAAITTAGAISGATSNIAEGNFN